MPLPDSVQLPTAPALLWDDLRARDRDRYFASLFAPVRERRALLALHDYDLTLADIVRTSSDRQLGLIRLAWWRDAVAGLPARPIAGQPLLEMLAACSGLDFAALAALAETQMDRIENPALFVPPGASFFQIAARLLAADLAGEQGESLVAAGGFWAAATEIRRGLAVAVEAPKLRFPGALRPITALAAAARRDARGRREPRGAAGRQIAMLRHMLTGRL